MTATRVCDTSPVRFSSLNMRRFIQTSPQVSPLPQETPCLASVWTADEGEGHTCFLLPSVAILGYLILYFKKVIMSSDETDCELFSAPLLEEPTQEASQDEDTQATIVSELPSQQQERKKRSRDPDVPPSTKKKNQHSKKNSSQSYVIDPSDFHTEDVIHLVHSRPSLWNKKDKKHSDAIFNRKKWDEIYCSLFKDYLKFDIELQDIIATKVQKRWRSVRDSYFKWLTKTKLPSGSAGKVTNYKHAESLSFLRPVSDMRPTTSNVEPLEEAQGRDTADLIEITGEQSRPALPEASESTQQYQVSRRHSSKKKNEHEREKLLVDTLQKLEDSVNTKFLQLDMRVLRLEGMVTGPAASPCRDFLLTLVPSMERMSEETQNNFKIKLLKVTQEFLNPPPPTPMYPPPSPSLPRPRQYQTPTYTQPRTEENYECDDGNIYRRI